MKRLLIVLSAFSFLATSLAGIAYAEAVCDPFSELCTSQHVSNENTTDDDYSKEGYKPACNDSHAHCHNHVFFTVHNDPLIQYSSKEQSILRQDSIYLPDLVYGLKRPPRA